MARGGRITRQAADALRWADAGEGKELKIGEVSKRSGVGIEALRFYERSGLLGRPLRTASGYRLYDAGVLDRLAFIRQAQVLGFSLDEIRQIIAEKQLGKNPCAEVREIVRLRLRELDERMREMQRYRKELAAALAEWDAVGEREGDICGLIESTHIEHPAPATGAVKRGKAKTTNREVHTSRRGGG